MKRCTKLVFAVILVMAFGMATLTGCGKAVDKVRSALEAQDYDLAMQLLEENTPTTKSDIDKLGYTEDFYEEVANTFAAAGEYKKVWEARTYCGFLNGCYSQIAVQALADAGFFTNAVPHSNYLTLGGATKGESGSFTYDDPQFVVQYNYPVDGPGGYWKENTTTVSHRCVDFGDFTITMYESDGEYEFNFTVKGEDLFPPDARCFLSDALKYFFRGSPAQMAVYDDLLVIYTPESYQHYFIVDLKNGIYTKGHRNWCPLDTDQFEFQVEYTFDYVDGVTCRTL